MVQYMADPPPAQARPPNRGQTPSESGSDSFRIGVRLLPGWGQTPLAKESDPLEVSSASGARQTRNGLGREASRGRPTTVIRDRQLRCTVNRRLRSFPAR